MPAKHPFLPRRSFLPRASMAVHLGRGKHVEGQKDHRGQPWLGSREFGKPLRLATLARPVLCRAENCLTHSRIRAPGTS